MLVYILAVLLKLLYTKKTKKKTNYNYDLNTHTHHFNSNLHYSVGSGGWSTDNVTTVISSTYENKTTVKCSSTHLTSFAVLVNVAGNRDDVSHTHSLHNYAST